MDLGTIARFGQLTKNEIQIFCILDTCRDSRGKCDPGRQRIAEISGIQKQNVSRAILGLIFKGWIRENDDGFDLAENPGKKNQIDYPIRQNARKLTPAGIKLITIPEPVENSHEPVENPVENHQIDYKSVIKLITNPPMHIKNSSLKQSSKNSKKGIKRTVPAVEKKLTRIPEDFDLTEEMKIWFYENVGEELRTGPETCTADFIEYWTNRTDKKSFAVDWFLRWKKGMRLLLQWQREDLAERRAKSRGPGSHEPNQLPGEHCKTCGGARTIDDPDDPGSAAGIPCPICRNAEYRSHGRRKAG